MRVPHNKMRQPPHYATGGPINVDGEPIPARPDSLGYIVSRRDAESIAAPLLARLRELLGEPSIYES